jgi:hypothetical protein
MSEKFKKLNLENRKINKAEDNKPDALKKHTENLAPELLPYKAEMEEWIKSHLDDLTSFLQYKGAKFKLVCGDGFYYQLATDTICLSVPYYKACKESGKMTIDQILFGSFHEFAHLKTMMEADKAGRENHKMQFNYESSKKIRDKSDRTRFANLQPTYRHFYNVLEDAVVNSMVLNTRHYGENVSAAGKRRAGEIKKLYTDQFFSIFKHVPAGSGSYALNEKYKADPENEDKYIFVGEGKGDLEIFQADDYETGFNWNEAEPEMGRSGQFITAFLKNQMKVLDADNVYDEEVNPEGGNILHEDVAMIFNRPLVEVYETLLKKIQKKYKNDPAQLERYLEFMGEVVKVQNYKESNGKVVEWEVDLVPNVINPNCIEGNRIDTNTAVNLFLDNELKKSPINFGETGVHDIKFLEIFNQYKTTKAAKDGSWTRPLKYSLDERSRITRKVLEPIFTMLCILDDSFDVTLPPETPPGPPGTTPPGPPGPPKSPEIKPEWKKGDKVIVRRDGLPEKEWPKALVTNINYDVQGNIVSVNVEYIEETSKQVNRLESLARTEEIFDPYKNLKLIAEKGKKGKDKQKQPKDPRKKWAPEEEEKEPEKEPEEPEEPEEEDKKEDEENDDEDENDGENKDDKDDKDGKDGKKSKEQKDKELMEKVEADKKFIEDLMEAEEREENLKKLEDSKKTNQYKERKYNEEKAEELLKKLRAAKKNEPEEPFDPENPKETNEETVAQFIELEKILRPYADKMAQAWLEIVNNIAAKIEVVKDKYYRSGKVDIKKLQKYLPEIELGREMDDRLIYERFVEKIYTSLQPRMLRLLLLVDNSGSMSDYVSEIRVAVMLLNSSLRSFKVLLKERMTDILGSGSDEMTDLICDTEIHTFGEGKKMVKPFSIKNLDFLNEEKGRAKEDSINDETLNTLLAFQKIDANEGDTLDGDLWAEIFDSHDNPQLKDLIAKNKLTEVILQISDGAIGQESEAIGFIQKLKKIGLSVAGLAIGSASAEASLKRRHGEDNVRVANDAAELADKFGDLLKQIISDKVEKPMIESLNRVIEE